jgi:type I restriction enzyme S subunit
MFGDSLKKNSRVPILPLGEVVDLGSGATPSKEHPEFWNGRTPWVSPKDMKAEEITDAEDHVSAAAFEKSNLQLIPKDTVLIVVRGMILAHTVPIRLCRVSVAINQDMKSLLPKQPIDPEFLRWSLQAKHPHLLNQVSTAGHGTKKLDSDRLREVTIPIPPLAPQNEFAARVFEIRALRADQSASRRRLDDLFQSMLHRAFQGEL